MELQQLVRRAVGLALSGVIGAALVGTVVAPRASAAGSFTFDVIYNQWCASVEGGTPLASGVMRQLDATGGVIDSQELSLKNDGSDTACFSDTWAAGMKLQATIDGTTRTVTLPRLTLRVNRVTDMLSGTGPAGKPISISVTHYTSFNSSAYYPRVKTISSTGTWSKDFTPIVNVIGGDMASLLYLNSASDVFQVFELAPRLQVWVNRSAFGSELLSNTGGKVTLRNGAGTFRGSGYTAWGGNDTPILPYSLFHTSAGTPVVARIGDKVSSSLQSDMAFTIPTLTISTNAATDVMSGSCPANRKLKWTVYVSTGSTSTAYVGAGVCSAAGTYSVDLTANYDVFVGQPVEIVARLGSGDLVARRKAAQ